MEKMAAQRFLIYAPNGFGLGHIVRQLALARQIRKRDPRAELLFLTDCEASHLIWREGFIVFVAFGSGGDRRYRRFLDVVFAYAARFPDWTLAVLRPPYYDGHLPVSHGNRVVSFSYFPLAEAWRAFDAAITAMGNNTTTELLHNGVPSIFLPLPGTEDDHLARAARIRDADAGIILETDSKDRVLPAFEALADPATRHRIAANAARLVPDNGAERAAAMLLDWLETRGPVTGLPTRS